MSRSIDTAGNVWQVKDISSVQHIKEKFAGGLDVTAREELIKSLLDRCKGDESVLGFILVGSLGKGYGDERSDVDLELVVTEDRYKEQKRRDQGIIRTEKHDLIFTTIDRLQRVKESERDEDHWSYRDCPVLFDRTGKLADIVKEIAEYDRILRLDKLKRYYLGYWENTLSSIGCLRRKNIMAARIYAAIAMQELIRLLFNLNYRWAPEIRWAFKELHQLERTPARLGTKIEMILSEPSSDNQSSLWDETAELLREEGLSWVDRPEEIS